MTAIYLEDVRERLAQHENPDECWLFCEVDGAHSPLTDSLEDLVGTDLRGVPRSRGRGNGAGEVRVFHEID